MERRPAVADHHRVAPPHTTGAPSKPPRADCLGDGRDRRRTAPGRQNTAAAAARERRPAWHLNRLRLLELGDAIAAMIGPLVAGVASESFALFLSAAAITAAVRSLARSRSLDRQALNLIVPVTATLATLAVLLADRLLGGPPHPELLAVTGMTAAASGLATLAMGGLNRRFGHVRVALIGTAQHALALRAELASEGVSSHSVVGYIEHPPSGGPNTTALRPVDGDVQHLGPLNRLHTTIEEHRIDLLVLPQGGDRLAVFEQVAACLGRSRTRLVGLSAFTEYVFQRVPIDELNPAWLQHMMHPHYRCAPALLIRALDVAGALVMGLLSMPIWVTAALAVRLEGGGPALYRQVRTGIHGDPFTIIKFRSMRTDAESDGPQWSTGTSDARVTRVGKVLRRFHVDELPQLINVLRGDMSLVGPRPERPEFVHHLEQEVPFYGRRHLLKPGVTGWAQVRAGYGMTDEGQVNKLSQDLFYLKHHSVLLYVYVLLATCVTVVRGTVHSQAN